MGRNEIGKGSLSHVVEQLKLSWEHSPPQALKFLIRYWNGKMLDQRLCFWMLFYLDLCWGSNCCLEIWVNLSCLPNSLSHVNVSVFPQSLWIPSCFHCLRHLCPPHVHSLYFTLFLEGYQIQHPHFFFFIWKIHLQQVFHIFSNSAEDLRGHTPKFLLHSLLPFSLRVVSPPSLKPWYKMTFMPLRDSPTTSMNLLIFLNY